MIIQDHITLSHKFLTKKIRTHLFEIFKEKNSNKCTKEYGYILSVNHMTGFDQVQSSKNNVFLVECDVDVFKPEKDMVVSGNVIICLERGIIVLINNVHKVFIPTSNMTNFSYKKDKQCFRDSNGKEIQKDTIISVRLINIEFSSGKYQSTGIIEV